MDFGLIRQSPEVCRARRSDAPGFYVQVCTGLRRYGEALFTSRRGDRRPRSRYFGLIIEDVACRLVADACFDDVVVLHARQRNDR